MQTCSTCKWWYETFRIVTGESCGHSCALMSDNEFIGDSGVPRPPEEKHQKLARVVAYEPSDVRTEPNFGCVQWEGKDGQ